MNVTNKGAVSDFAPHTSNILLTLNDIREIRKSWWDWNNHATNKLVVLPPTQLTALTTASRGCCQWWRRWSGWSWRTAASTTSTCPSWACPSSAQPPLRWHWGTIAPPSARTGWVWSLKLWVCLITESAYRFRSTMSVLRVKNSVVRPPWSPIVPVNSFLVASCC